MTNMYNPGVLLLLIVVTAMPASTTAADVAERARQINDAVLAGRSRIKSGHFLVLLSQFDAGRKTREDLELNTYVKGAMIHEERLRKGVRVVRCYSDDWYYEYSDAIAAGQPTCLVMKRFDAQNKEAGNGIVFKPLKLMLYPVWYSGLSTLPLTILIGSPRQTDFRVEDATIDGNKCVKVSCDFSSSSLRATAAYWVVPTKHYAVVRMETRDQWDTFAWSQCKLAEVGDGIWFPVSVHVEQLVSGALQLREDLSIKADRINEPLEDSLFSPAGLGVPADTIIARHPADPRGSIKWDGASIVGIGVEEAVRLATPRATVSQYHRSTWLMLGSAFLAAVAAISIWRGSRSRKEPR